MARLSLQGKHIAITRPIDQAKKLCAMIEKAGGHALLFPLIEIAPLANYSEFEDAIADLQQYDWLIFISSNAVQNGMPRLLKAHPNLPDQVRFAAIGPVTAKEIQGFCNKPVLTPQDRFDSESLLALPEMQAMQGKKVMIIRGVGGRELLADTLAARGAQVSFAECYQRINPQVNADLLRDAFAQKQLDGVVVTSSEAVRYLLQLAGNSSWLKHTPIFVNHARVAEPADALGLSTHIATTAGDEAICTLLGTTLSESDSQK